MKFVLPMYSARQSLNFFRFSVKFRTVLNTTSGSDEPWVMNG
jgi:hypothetical protein